jgi:hypothetical protein
MTTEIEIFPIGIGHYNGHHPDLDVDTQIARLREIWPTSAPTFSGRGTPPCMSETTAPSTTA